MTNTLTSQTILCKQTLKTKTRLLIRWCRQKFNIHNTLMRRARKMKLSCKKTSGNRSFAVQVFAILLVLVPFKAYSQKHDTANVVMKYASYDFYWTTLGISADPVNSGIGVVVSNGYDERPLMHFEDLSSRILYRLAGELYKGSGFTVGGKLQAKYFRRIFGFPGIEALWRDIGSDFQQRQAYLFTSVWFKPLPFELVLKGGYQQLDGLSKGGLGLGLETRIGVLYGGVGSIYHFDYFYHSAFLQSFVWKKLGLRIEYERVAGEDFLRVGLHLTLPRKKAE